MPAALITSDDGKVITTGQDMQYFVIVVLRTIWVLFVSFMVYYPSIWKTVAQDREKCREGRPLPCSGKQIAQYNNSELLIAQDNSEVKANGFRVP